MYQGEESIPVFLLIYLLINTSLEGLWGLILLPATPYIWCFRDHEIIKDSVQSVDSMAPSGKLTEVLGKYFISFKWTSN